MWSTSLFTFIAYLHVQFPTALQWVKTDLDQNDWFRQCFCILSLEKIKINLVSRVSFSLLSAVCVFHKLAQVVQGQDDWYSMGVGMAEGYVLRMVFFHATVRVTQFSKSCAILLHCKILKMQGFKRIQRLKAPMK